MDLSADLMEVSATKGLSRRPLVAVSDGVNKLIKYTPKVEQMRAFLRGRAPLSMVAAAPRLTARKTSPPRLPHRSVFFIRDLFSAHAT
jgi:hypothetical protein